MYYVVQKKPNRNSFAIISRASPPVKGKVLYQSADIVDATEARLVLREKVKQHRKDMGRWRRKLHRMAQVTTAPNFSEWLNKAVAEHQKNEPKLDLSFGQVEPVAAPVPRQPYRQKTADEVVADSGGAINLKDL